MYELTFFVEAPTPAQVRDLGDAFREAFRKSQAKGCAGDDRLPYLDCKIDHITVKPADCDTQGHDTTEMLWPGTAHQGVVCRRCGSFLPC